MAFIIQFLPWVTNLLLVLICLRQTLLVPFLSGRFLYRLHVPSRGRHLLGAALVVVSMLLFLSSILSQEELAIRLIVLCLCVLTYVVTILRGEGILAHGLLFDNGWIPDAWVKSYHYTLLEDQKVLVILLFTKKHLGQAGRAMLIQANEMPEVSRILLGKYGEPTILDKKK